MNVELFNRVDETMKDVYREIDNTNLSKIKMQELKQKLDELLDELHNLDLLAQSQKSLVSIAKATIGIYIKQGEQNERT